MLQKNSILDSLLLFDVRIFVMIDVEEFQNGVGGPVVLSVSTGMVLEMVCYGFMKLQAAASMRFRNHDVCLATLPSSVEDMKFS